MSKGTRRCYENFRTTAVECSSCQHQHRCEMGRDLREHLKQFTGRIDITEDQADVLAEADKIDGYIWESLS